MKLLYKRFIDVLDKMLINFSMIAMLIIILINFYDYIQRFFFRTSFHWGIDLTQIVFEWVILLTFSVVVKRKKNIVINFLYDKLPIYVQKYVKLIILILMFIFSVVIVKASITLAIGQKNIPIHTLMPLTETYRTLAISFGFFFILIFLIYEIWEEVEKLVKKRSCYD